jgi:hypothetical protein
MMTEHNGNPLAAAILDAIERRLGWRATDEGRKSITADALGILLERGDGHLGAREPDRVWARPFQAKGGIPSVAITAFWGDQTLHITALGRK